MSNKTTVNANWFLHMVLEEGSILVLNPKDECPHFSEEFEKMVKYEHGNVNIEKDKCSIAFVFQVVSKYFPFRTSDNCLISKDRIPSSDAILKEMDKMYEEVDIDNYHDLILDKFHSILE